MNRFHLVCTRVVLAAMLTTPVVFATGSGEPDAATTENSSENLQPVVTEPSLQSGPLFVAAGSGHQSGARTSYLVGPGFGSAGFGIEAAVCDWYDITCSNGSTEECCGSDNSCLGYCEVVCGEPCILVE